MVFVCQHAYRVNNNVSIIQTQQLKCTTISSLTAGVYMSGTHAEPCTRNGAAYAMHGSALFFAALDSSEMES